MDTEEWAAIPNWPKYEVSSKGRVRRKETGLILAGAYTRGRRSVTLRNNPIQENRRVYRLVAESFIPNPENKPQVNHIDGNSSNDAVENLEWVTAQENHMHARNVLKNMGRFHPGTGSAHHQAKLTEADVVTIRALAAAGMKPPEIAAKFKVTRAPIHNILKGKTWRHVT